jgi:hypothetical protein
MTLVPRGHKCKCFDGRLARNTNRALEDLMFDNSCGTEVACSFQNRLLMGIVAGVLTSLLWRMYDALEIGCVVGGARQLICSWLTIQCRAEP